MNFLQLYRNLSPVKRLPNLISPVTTTYTSRLLKHDNKFSHSNLVHSTAKCRAEKSFLAPNDVISYVRDHSTAPDPFLANLGRKTQLAFPKEAYKMVSPIEGLFLAFLARVTRAKTVLEIGCFTGYSTVSIAEGLRHRVNKGAKIIAIDVDPLSISLAKKHVELAGLTDLVEFKTGNALDIIEDFGSDLEFDMIFIDANKSGYVDYYKAIMDQDLLSRNGIIVADNALFRGYVRAFSDPHVRFSDLSTSEGPVPHQFKHTARNIHHFNDVVQNDTRTDNLLLPIFDGVMLIWRRKSAPVEIPKKYQRYMAT